MRLSISILALALWFAAYWLAWQVNHSLMAALVLLTMGSNLSEWAREDKLKENIRRYLSHIIGGNS